MLGSKGYSDQLSTSTVSEISKQENGLKATIELSNQSRRAHRNRRAQCVGNNRSYRTTQTRVTLKKNRPDLCSLVMFFIFAVCGKCFWILGRVFGFWDVFWILGRALDCGKCFWILEGVLDSGKCFWILGSVWMLRCVFGFWDVFWILGSVLSPRATVEEASKVLVEVWSVEVPVYQFEYYPENGIQWNLY